MTNSDAMNATEASNVELMARFILMAMLLIVQEDRGARAKGQHRYSTIHGCQRVLRLIVVARCLQLSHVASSDA